MRSNQLSRRKAIAGIGSIGAAGIGLYSLTGDAQAADVSIDGLSIPDKHKLVRSEVQDVRINATIQYSYTGNTVPDKLEIVIHVGSHAEEMYPVVMWEKDDVQLESNEGERRLEGSILGTPTYDLQQFQPSNAGDVKTSNMMILVEFRVIANQQVQSRATAEDSHQLSVENGTITISNDVGGTGNMSVETAE